MICGVEVLRIRRGTLREVARTLDLNNNTVLLWRRVPAEAVFIVAKIVGCEPEILRPDLFLNDPIRSHLVTAEMLKAASAIPGNRRFVKMAPHHNLLHRKPRQTQVDHELTY